VLLAKTDVLLVKSVGTMPYKQTLYSYKHIKAE